MPVPPLTARLAFREMTPDDLDDMAALLSDPEVMRQYPDTKNREEALAWIAWSQRLYREHEFGLQLLTLQGSGEFVGDCGLTPQQVDGITEIEVGYHVRACPQGRGLATNNGRWSKSAAHLRHVAVRGCCDRLLPGRVAGVGDPASGSKSTRGGPADAR